MDNIDFTKVISASEVAEGLRRQLIGQLRQRRDEAIAAGVTMSGMAIATDDVSQGRIVGAALQAVIDPTITVNWKVSTDAFITLTAAQILGIAVSVRAYIQACFDHEAALIGQIAAGQTPDITAGWPATTL